MSLDNRDCWDSSEYKFKDYTVTHIIFGCVKCLSGNNIDKYFIHSKEKYIDQQTDDEHRI